MTDNGEESLDMAVRLMTGCRTGALATLAADGSPFSSFVAVACSQQAEPILLLSSLAVHTQNLQRDSRASLLLSGDAVGTDPLTAPRLTVTGRATVAAQAESAKETYLAAHPAAAGYAGFGDFAFYTIAVSAGHLVAGFGRIASIDAAELRRACRRGT